MNFENLTILDLFISAAFRYFFLRVIPNHTFLKVVTSHSLATFLVEFVM